MTNGNVEQVVTGVDGETLTVKYKDGEMKIIVPPGVRIERTHGWSHEWLYGFARVMSADGGQAAINIALR